MHPRKAFIEFYLAGEPFMLDVFAGECSGLPEPWSDEAAGSRAVVTLGIEPANPRNHQDLAHDEKGLSLRMSFGGRPHRVSFPWRAVHVIHTPECVCVWQHAQVAAAPKPPKPEPEPEPELPRGSHLKVVK